MEAVLSKRYYLMRLTGDGSYENPIRPDLPKVVGYSALIPTGATEALVLVLADEAQHDECSRKAIREVPAEEAQLIARELDPRLTRWEADVALLETD